MGWIPHLFLALFLLRPGPFLAADTGFPRRLEQVYKSTRQAWMQAPTNVSTTWIFARAAFDWAEAATNSSQRASVANEAIHACRAALSRATNSVPLQYYLALNLGQLAQTRGLSALKMVREMEALWVAAQSRDPAFDHAGPDRCLGLLYLDAPGWPASVGNHSKARLHLERAVALEPDYPENRLCLAEAELKWKQRGAALKQLESLDALWPKARQTWKDANHLASWSDWERRRSRMRAALARPAR